MIPWSDKDHATAYAEGLPATGQTLSIPTCKGSNPKSPTPEAGAFLKTERSLVRHRPRLRPMVPEALETAPRQGACRPLQGFGPNLPEAGGDLVLFVRLGPGYLQLAAPCDSSRFRDWNMFKGPEVGRFSCAIPRPHKQLSEPSTLEQTT